MNGVEPFHLRALVAPGSTRIGADNGTRTRDIFVGNEVLYQLSYIRDVLLRAGRGNRTPVISLEGCGNDHYTTPACYYATNRHP